MVIQFPSVYVIFLQQDAAINSLVVVFPLVPVMPMGVPVGGDGNWQVVAAYAGNCLLIYNVNHLPGVFGFVY